MCKNAFEIIGESFEKIAKQMPYVLPNGEYAAPRGWMPQTHEDESDREYFRDEHKIPEHFKVIARDGFGNNTFVDTRSDKNNPDYYDWDHETTELRKWSDKEKIKNFSAGNPNNEIYNKLKNSGIKSSSQINKMTPEQLKAFGYTKSKGPTILDKAKYVGKGLADSYMPQAGATFGALLGTNGKADSLKLALKGAGKGALAGALIGTGIGVGLNAWGGDYKKMPKKEDNSENFRNQLKNHYWDGLEDDEFVSQYNKQAFNIINESFEKIAKIILEG